MEILNNFMTTFGSQLNIGEIQNAFGEGLDNMRNLAKAKLIDFEKVNTSSLFEIANASEKMDSQTHGKIYAYIDSTVSFFCAIWTSLARVICNLALALLALPCALFSEKGRDHLITHLYRAGIDLGCALVAISGTVYPFIGKVNTLALNFFIAFTIFDLDISNWKEEVALYAMPILQVARPYVDSLYEKAGSSLKV